MDKKTRAFMENMFIDYRLWKWKYKVSQATNEIREEFHGKIAARSSIFKSDDNINVVLPMLYDGINWNLQEYINFIERDTCNPKFALLHGYQILLHLGKNIEEYFEKEFGIPMKEYYPQKEVK